MRDNLRPLVLMELGLIMVSSILLCVVLGLWIDNRFGIAPWGLLIAMLVGVSSGSLAMYRLVARVLKDVGKGPRD